MELKNNDKKDKLGSKIFKAIKENIFMSFHVILANNLCHISIYLILIIYEFLQIVSYLYHTFQYSSQAESLFYKFIISITDFTENILTSQSSLVIYIFLEGAYVFIFSSSFLYFYFIFTRKNNYSLPNGFGKIISILWILSSKILLLPSLITFLDIYLCNITKGSTTYQVVPFTCYSQIHIILIIVSSITMILIMALEILFTTFFNDFSPNSELPWSNASIFNEFVRLGRKIVIAISIFIVHQSSIGYLVIVIGFNILSLFTIYELFRHLFMNNRIVQYILTSLELSSIWIGILTGFSYFVFGIDILNDIYIFIEIPIIFIGCNYILSKFREKIFYVTRIENLRSIKEITEYINTIMNLAANQSKFENYILLRGSVSNHLRNCVNSNCKCEELFKSMDLSNQDEVISNSSNMGRSVKHLSFKTAQQRNISERSQALKIESGAFNSTILYDFLAKSLLRSIDVLGKKPSLFIQLAYIHFIFLENKFIALYDLTDALKQKASFLDEYKAFRLNKMIEIKLMTQDNGSNEGNLLAAGSVNMAMLIPFQEKFANFQSKIDKLLEMFVRFWKELLEESPNFQHVNKLGFKTSKEIILLKKMYGELIKLNPNNIQCRMIYALFVKKIEKNDHSAVEVVNELNQAQTQIEVNKKFNILSAEDKYGTNSKSTIILVSGNKTTIGEVINSNNEVSELLGYDKIDILGNNVSMLMPSALGDKHDLLIQNYFEKPNSEKLLDEKDKIVYAMHKSGLIVPCSLTHKIVPSLSKGIQLIGFMLPAENIAELRVGEERVGNDDVGLIITDNNWNIHGFNSKAALLFGIDIKIINIRRHFTSDELLNLSKLIPRLEDPDTERNLKSEIGLEVTMDLENIRKEVEAEIDTTPEGEIGSSEHTGRFISTENPEDSDKGESCSISSLKRGAKYLKGNVKYVDKFYGRSQNNLISHLINYRLVTIKFNERNQKEISKTKEITKVNANTTNTKINLPDVEDNLSQSTNSQESLLKMESRFIKDFKEKIQDMIEPAVLRILNYLGIILFLALIAITLSDLLLKNSNISYMTKSLNLTMMAFGLNKQIVNIPLYTRILFNIRNKTEEKSSIELQDRIEFYMKEISESAEMIRVKHLTIIESNRVDKEASIILTQLKDYNNPTSFLYTTYTYQNAINSYIASTTNFQSEQQFLNTLDANNNKSLESLKSFLIENGKNSVRKMTNKMARFILSDSIDSFSRNKTTLIILGTVGSVFMILVSLIFLPYIMSVQMNIITLFDHICDMDSQEIRGFLESCNAFHKDIQAPYLQLSEIYKNEDFEIELEEDDENKKKHKNEDENEEDSGRKSGKNKEDSESSSKRSDDSEETLLPVNEQKALIKRTLVSRIANTKRCSYIIRLSILICFFIIFLSVNITNLVNYFNTTDLAFNLIPVLSNREVYLKELVLFQRENIINKDIYLENGINYVEQLIGLNFNSERTILSLRKNLTDSLKDYSILLDEVDLNACSILSNTNPFSKIDCKTINYGCLATGFSNTLISLIRAYQDSFYSVQNSGYDNQLANLKANQGMSNIDIFPLFIEDEFLYLDNQYELICGNNFSSYTSANNIIFFVFVITFFALFFIVWKNLLNNLKMDILKVKGVFNLLPTRYLTKNFEFIKKMFKTNIFS